MIINIQAVRQLSFEGGELKSINPVCKQQHWSLDGYKVMKDFYKEMTDMLNEPIVMKLPN
jgi:hypothetical protein